MIVIKELSRDDIRERLVALTRDLILIPSIQSRPEDLQKCFEFIKNHLESLDNIEVREFKDNGIPSLVAAPRGCHKPKILMCGHLDVITHPDIACYRSQITDGRIYGPGAGDMKGALAILLEIFRHMHTQKDNVPLGIAVTADEEVGGASGIGYLFKVMGLRCSQAMIPDGGSINEITVEEKGILHLTLYCEGKTSHAARPWLGDNPLEKLMERLSKLRLHFENLKNQEDRWYPTCAITILETENQTVNRIPTNAKATIDVRFPAPFTVEKMLNEIRSVLGEDIRVDIIIHAQPTQLSPDDLYCSITQEIVKTPVKLIRDDGGSDARYISVYGIPVLMSRPKVGNLHGADEWIDIESMVDFYRIYEKYLTQMLL